MSKDLTKKEDAVELLKSSNSVAEWNENVVLIQKANGGSYPSFWYGAVVQSGLYNEVAKTFGGREAIVVETGNRRVEIEPSELPEFDNTWIRQILKKV